MAAYHFSRRAESDLLSIGTYTLEIWKEAQLLRYMEKLENCCQTLAENPILGRPCNHIRPGLRRITEGKHVIFYRQEPGGILISRILHERMLPERHPFDEEDDDKSTARESCPLPEQIPKNKHRIRRTFSQTSHQVGVPFGAEGYIDAAAPAFLDQPL